MPLLDDNDESPGGIVSEIVDEALKSPPKSDPDEPREPAWLRCLQYGALIVGPAIFFGLVFAFGDYITQFTGRHYYLREQAEQRVQHDSIAALKWRFLVGAGIGAALGALYVVRCIFRKVDP